MDDDEELQREKPASHGSQRVAWWITGAMVGWMLLTLLTGSVLRGLLCDIALGGLVAGVAVARRIGGPFPPALRARPWRGEARALHAAARQFPSVFEHGSWEDYYAPSRVEVHMSPGCVARLHQALGPEIVTERLEESYRSAIRRHQARVSYSARLSVTLVPDAGVPDGAAVVRRASGGSGPMVRPEPAWAMQARAEPTWGGWAPAAQDGLTAVDPDRPHPAGGRGAAGPPVPRLTLLTGGARCSTTERRATAGRDPQCDLVITAARTISRYHGIFSYTDGRWWLENTGRNGIQVNEVPIDTIRALGDGNVIRWGSLDSSPTSIVQISVGARL